MMLPRWLLGWMLVALVGAQPLGFVHRIAHGPHAAAGHAIAGQATAQAHWADALFAGHQGERDCRLFDALGADPVRPAGPVLPALPPVATAPLLVAIALPPGPCPAPYLARGPPPSR